MTSLGPARHLLGQAPQARRVPQSIRVDVVLLDPSQEFAPASSDHRREIPRPQRERRRLGTLFELSAERVRSWTAERGDRLPAGDIELPDPLERRLSAMLMTEVRTGSDHVLSDYESGLTVPRPLSPEAVMQAGARLQFRYRLGAYPGLICVPL